MVRNGLLFVVLVGAAPAARAVQLADRVPVLFAVERHSGARVDASGAPVFQRSVALDLHGATVADALDAIARETDVRFTYEPNVLPAARRVSAQARSISLAAALTEVLSGTGLDVQLTGVDHLVIVAREPTTSAIMPRRGRQARRMTGRVIDAESRLPIPAALVFVRGTTISTTTSDSGTFALAIPDTATEIVVRRLGYRLATATVAAADLTVTIALTKDVLRLDAEIVTGVATTISSRNAANAVAVVNADQIAGTPAPTLENAIQGKIPGALIEQNNGGAPGGGLQIQIRGITSIESTASPLYVVDGVIVNNQTVNSGANAVTAGGLVPGQVGSALAQSAYDNSPNRLADINPADIESIEVLKGSSASAIYGAQAASGVIIITTKKGAAGRTAWSATQRLGTYTLANELPLRTFPTLQRADAWYLAYKAPGDAGTPAAHADSAYVQSVYAGPQDYQRQLFGGGELSYETDLSARGAALRNTTSYFLSALSKYDNGLMPNTGYNKQSVRSNVSTNLASSLTVGANLFYTHALTRRGITGNDNVGIAPYDVFSSTPQFVNLARPSGAGAWSTNPFGVANPFADASQIQTPEVINRFIAGGTLDWSAYSAAHQTLHVILIGGADFATQHDQIYAPPGLQVERANPAGLPGVATSLDASTTYSNYSLSLVHHFTGVSALSATTSLGIAGENRSFNNTNNVGQNLVAGANSFTAGTVQTGFFTQTGLQDFSLYAQEQVLTLAERLSLTAGVTAERSSENGEINAFYTYPKFSASYRLPRIEHVFDDIKLRAAGGQSGTLPLYGVRYNPLVQQLIEGQSGTYPNTALGNPRIKPETNTEIEAGADVTLAGSRAQLGATVYQKRITNVLLQAAHAASFGSTSQWINGGEFTNQGLELSLSMTPIQMRNGLTWVSTSTYYRNYSVVNRLDVPSFDITGGGAFGANRIQVGRSVSQIVNEGVAPDRNGTFPQVGDVQPAFTMGFSNDFTVGPFRLATVLDWKNGGNAIDFTRFLLDVSPGLMVDSAAAVQRLIGFSKGSPVYVEPGGYVKLREVTMSVEVPSRWLRAIPRLTLSSARLSLSGRNLWSSFAYHGLDPEVSAIGNTNIARGEDIWPFPPARSYFISLDLGI